MISPFCNRILTRFEYFKTRIPFLLTHLFTIDHHKVQTSTIFMKILFLNLFDYISNALRGGSNEQDFYIINVAYFSLFFYRWRVFWSSSFYWLNDMVCNLMQYYFRLSAFIQYLDYHYHSSAIWYLLWTWRTKNSPCEKIAHSDWFFISNGDFIPIMYSCQADFSHF